MYGGGGRNRTGVHGFAGRCMTTLPPRHITTLSTKKGKQTLSSESGAGNETRTHDLYLGKVSLYQLSYSRKKRSSHYRDIDCCVKKIG